MGLILKATCPCGFEEKDIYYGGGMMNFSTHCGVPALNLKTKKLLAGNYFNKDKLSKEIVFYNDPNMYEGELEHYIIQWGDVHLNPGHNLCPMCYDFTMKFQDAGYFD